MKTLKEALFSKKNLRVQNPFGLTEKDLIGEIEGFPMGVIVRVLEEQELQGKEPDITDLQLKRSSGFTWHYTQNGWNFWNSVMAKKDFNLFFKKYPEYEKYNL